jgi:hypothetical protein
MTSFSDWYCLKEDRTFMVFPDQDPEFYFGRAALAEEITQRIERGIMLHKSPRLVLYGAFGAGKTHTLYHIKWYLDHHEEYRFETRLVDTPPHLGRHTRYEVLHQAMMDKIGLATAQRLSEAFITKNLANLPDALSGFFNHDEDFINVIRVLAQGGPGKLTAWKWLRGEALSDPQMQSLEVARTPKLGDTIDILLAFGRLFQDVDNSRLVFLIDELDQLEFVTGDEISTWTAAFRQLADQSNRSVGFVLALRGAGDETLPEPLQHEAVTTRIGVANFVEIPYLYDQADLHAFVTDLVSTLVDQDCARAKLTEADLDSPIDTFPFSPEALELVQQYIYEDPLRALPREVLFTLDECAAAAVGKSPIVTEEIVQEVLP